MLEFKLKVYKENNLIWIGFLDSELYSEPFNEIKNYPVRFSGTDGFALLERFNYLDANGNKYTGLDTQWNVIKNILLKLGLEWNNIYISLSTTSNNFTISDTQTIFHKTYCNNQNWYNEDGDAETCRDVLEHILKPYGCYIIQDNANLYIVDTNTIAKNLTTSFKKFDSSFNYVSTVDLNLNLGDISTIKFAESNQQLNVVGGFNKQLILYSPYINADLLNYTASDYSTIVSSTVYGASPYSWKETIYSTSNTWLCYNNGKFADYVGNESSNATEGDNYLKINRYSTNGVSPSTVSFKLNKQLPYIIPAKSKIQITVSAYFRTVEDLNGITTTSDIYQGKLRCKLKIGDRQYRRHSTVNYPSSSILSGWISSASTTESFDLDFENRSIKIYNKTKISGYDAIDNNWISLKKYDTNGGYGDTLEIRDSNYLIPLNAGYYAGISGGMLEFEIYDWDIMVNPEASTTPNHDTIKSKVIDVRIKDLVIKIVDENGNEIEKSDVEYIGYMNAKFKNEGSKIETYQGTSKIDNSIEKGALIGLNEATGGYYFLKSWTREGKTDCIENLLLRSIVSNYTNKTVELTATINKLNSIVGCLTYQSFLPNKVFMVVGCDQNLSENTSTIRLQEISIDNLDINKSW